MEGAGSSATERRPMSPVAGGKGTVTATGLLPAATGAGGVTGGSHGGKALAPTITFSTKGIRGMVHGAGETLRESSTRSSSMDSTHDTPEHQGHDLLLLASSSSSSLLRAKQQLRQQREAEDGELEDGEIAQDQEEEEAGPMDVVRPLGLASSTISTPVKDAMSSSPSSSSLGTPCPNSPTGAAATPADAMRAAAAASPPPAPTHQRQASAVGEAAQSPTLPRLNLQKQDGGSGHGKPTAKSPSSLLAGLKEEEREAASVLRTLSASSSSSACDSPAPLSTTPSGPRWAQPPGAQPQQPQQQTLAAARPEPSIESLNSAATKQSRWRDMVEEGEESDDEDDNVIVMLHPDAQRRLQQNEQQRLALSSPSASESEEEEDDDDSDISVAEAEAQGCQAGAGKPRPTRKERRLLRQRDRAYHDPWQRIGYYKRCEEKYGPGSKAQYDSEDSDYEEPDADPQLLQQLGAQGLSGATASQYIRGTAGPFSGDFTEVRTTMLKIDALAAAAASASRGGGGNSGSGSTPKYLREWGKKVRRRDAASLLKQQLKEQQQSLQQRIRRERSRGEEEQDGGFRGGRRERAGSFAGSSVGASSYSPSLQGAGSLSLASSPQRSPGKKEKGFGGSGKKGGGGGGGGASKRFRIPGMPAPKRQSTALSLSYEKQPDGLIKCKRCGKPNFKNEFALRSHLSHCPGTIQMKEQRIKVEAGLLAPESVSVPAFADDGTGQLPAWVPNFSASSSNSNLSAQGSSRSCDGGNNGGGSGGKHHNKHARLPSSASSGSSSGASSHAPPPHHAHPLAPAPFQHHAAAASPSSSAPGASEAALPSPLAITRQQSDSSYASGPASPAPVFEGTPLVGSVLGEGEGLIGCTVAYKHRLSPSEWSDVRVKNYRSRRNTHLVVYPDATAEWVVLTDRNCRLPPNIALSLHQAGAGAGAAEDDAASMGGSSSGGSSYKRRASASAVALSTGTVADSAASSARNAFFSEQEALLASSRRPGAVGGGGSGLKRKASEGGDDGGSSVASSVTNARFAGQAQQQQQQDEQEEGARGSKAMKMGASASPAKLPAASPYPGGLPLAPPSGAGHLALPSALASQFACRRCLQSFHNKQALGWHTRKGCHGIAHLTGGDSGASSGSGAYGLPPPPPAMPIMGGYGAHMPLLAAQHQMVPPPPSPPMHAMHTMHFHGQAYAHPQASPCPDEAQAHAADALAAMGALHNHNRGF